MPSMARSFSHERCSFDKVSEDRRFVVFFFNKTSNAAGAALDISTEIRMAQVQERETFPTFVPRKLVRKPELSL